LEHKAHTAVLASYGGLPHVPSEPLDEEYWLDRAREAYALSDRMVYPEAKRLMREIAASYQRLAQSTEERTGRTKPRSRWTQFLSVHSALPLTNLNDPPSAKFAHPDCDLAYRTRW